MAEQRGPTPWTETMGTDPAAEMARKLHNGRTRPPTAQRAAMSAELVDTRRKRVENWLAGLRVDQPIPVTNQVYADLWWLVEMSKPSSAQRFVEAVMAATPNGERIAVQYHPNGDWFVAAKPLGAADTIDGLLAERERLREALREAEDDARGYAGFYPQASDGRNTLVILADKIAANSAALAQPPASSSEKE